MQKTFILGIDIHDIVFKLKFPGNIGLIQRIFGVTKMNNFEKTLNHKEITTIDIKLFLKINLLLLS